MPVVLTNNATSLLAAAIEAADTTISVQTADAGKFPNPVAGDWFPLTIVDNAGNMEILKATARSGAIITIERAQEGTTAKAFGAGSRVDLRLTWEALEALDGWAVQPIGVPIPLFAGAPLPSKSKRYRYVLLSAGETTVGKYNEGILSDETISGTAPTLTATAKINLQSSPLNGTTIHLINTSKLFLRPGTSQVIESGQNEAHSHTGSTAAAGSHAHNGTTATAGWHAHSAWTDSQGAHAHSITPMTSRNAGGTSWPAWEAGGAGTAWTSTAGAHGHNITVGGEGNHAHSFTTAAAGDHTHTVTVTNSGGDENRPRNMNIQYLLRVA
ncbi:hypothetical protein I2750_19755 [Bacillus sp. PR5]|nr:hypothetical protein [Bacillus sp. PR5]